ncbi:Phenylalanyl-tRNA synthetase beta chain [uncultured Candidatus Thioglobus sp.]|nr:Phenylalanyl-tRNA synthetase beta chain [uncultured Candidatus Thioglobus sp.]
MKISRQWLNEWIECAEETPELAQKLTMAGLEVESIQPISADFCGVITAIIHAVEIHPKQNHLKICQLSIGAEKDMVQVVCGGEVSVGLCVAFAPIGAELPKIGSIQSVSVSGVQSAGMLCSAMELGLATKSDNIFILPDGLDAGILLAELLRLEDQVIELSVTPNRSDCLSVSGIARELSAITHRTYTQVKIPEKLEIAENARKIREIIIDDQTACPKYIGQIIENLDISKISPLWLTEKLRRYGIRSINPVVDVNNYVMLELGQPMHAYDNDKLQGAIRVRYATEKEKLQILDVTVDDCLLSADTLVIADDNEVLSIAGIVGGKKSAVSANSKSIFLESAFFDPKVILGKAKQYRLHTDASHRFERGVDFTIQQHAIVRVGQLIIDICGGQLHPIVSKVSVHTLPKRQAIQLRYGQIERLLGITLAKEAIADILTDLGMQVTSNKYGWMVVPPSFRFDICIEADLIEEVARIHGYENINAQSLTARLHLNTENPLNNCIQKMRTLLVSRNFQEIINYSFVDPEILQILNPAESARKLVNPIESKLSVMRTSLLPCLVNTVLYNQNRQQRRMRLFEVGAIFQDDAPLFQNTAIAGIITGNINKKKWGTADILSDFFYLKGDVEALCEVYCPQGAISFETLQHPALHSGKSATILIDKQPYGLIGALHPTIQKKLGLIEEAFIFEIKISNINQKKAVKYCILSKFPSVRRDISLTVEKHVATAEIRDLIVKEAYPLLHELELLDAYQDQVIGLDKKSLLFSLIFQKDSSTLVDQEIDVVMERLIEALWIKFKARLRD